MIIFKKKVTQFNVKDLKSIHVIIYFEYKDKKNRNYFMKSRLIKVKNKVKYTLLTVQKKQF